MNKRFITLTSIAAVATSLGLAGCNRSDRDTAKSSAEEGVAQVDQKAREMGTDAKNATRDMADSAKTGAAKVGDKVDDAMITASVKTEIAKDSELSAMSVNVDTEGGRVALRGTAPSATAKEHATSLAAAVKGVASVDNQLTVQPK